MESNAPQAKQPEVVHHALTITLSAPGIDPGHINPDFLRYNGIVDSGWQIDYPVIIESGYSLIEYTNGLEISAEENDIQVSHTGTALAAEEIATADVMRRYLEMAPWSVEYISIATDWRGAIPFGDSVIGLQISPLHDLAQKVKVGDMVPMMEARAIYKEAPDKSITVYLSESVEENIITGIQFNIQIHRDIGKIPPEEREKFIRSTLDNWKEDIKDFEELASRFYFSYVQKES